MNRFRTKKKAKDDFSAGRSSEESEHSSLPFKGFRRGKKMQQDEVKKEFDLANALPSTDDFRTSLLMANLSARFSMLREQDDPNTKIGKASDDSVLFPKRQSRLADFGFGGANGGLTDIAEVESIKGPGFLRENSFASDDADSGKGVNVLTRARPTEGNNLFGGRQKIYKIPAGSGGALSGRALYDDDVALSAFQRWRIAERERSLEEKDNAWPGTAEEEAEQTQPESPPLTRYDRKRETSSTTSSASIMARNSTAATSITSQAAGAAKDGQSASSAPTSAVTSPAQERLVTRTRRLYEQGLAQDLHEQQASALSRIESLTRQRPLGTRTPDIPVNSTSTSKTNGFADRFASHNRTVLTKASAPNLRSASPSASGPSISALGLGTKVQTDTKLNLGGLPPLSPPMSETGEQPIQPILAGDFGKATSLGIFQKTSNPYDESKYVERQLQLQQGRGTPTQRPRTESNATSAPQSQIQEAKHGDIGSRPPIQEERLPPTPVSGAESSSSTVVSFSGFSMLRETNIERPSDKDHPAFRQSAMPTPLSIGNKASREPSPSPNNNASVDNTQQPSPVDSPTLGPTAGLSGMVRQHLRTESVDSSLYGASPESHSNLGSNRPSVIDEPESSANRWFPSDQDWTVSFSSNGSGAGSKRRGVDAQQKDGPSSDFKVPDRTSNATEDETDEFTSQLADARRRVREKLTSYVESDSSRAASPLLPSDPPKDLAAQASSHTLGVGTLKPKSSRGSLIDRSKSIVTGQSKGLKILGIGAATMSTLPQSGKQSFEEKETPHLETMKEEVSSEDAPELGRNLPEADTSAESRLSRDKDEESNAHPGLRAFRQARRELQKRKELETLARHQFSQTSQFPDHSLNQPIPAQPPARAERGPRQRTPSRERGPPPVAYRQRPPSDESYSSSTAQRPSGERDRSGSETSGSLPNSRLPRLRTNTNAEPQDHLRAPNPRQPMMRSPGLPGTDIKGSPLMPPYPYPGRGAPSPAPSPHLDRSRSTGNLALHSGRPGLDPHSGQPSPISPMGLPSPASFATGPAGSPAGTPTSLGPRPRQSSTSQSPAPVPMNGAIPGAMKRPVDKREISEPTFLMSTTRVPTVPLSHEPPHPHQPPPPVPMDGARPHGGPRSRSNSRDPGAAPPVPPINPRRRRDDSRTRPGYDDAGITTAQALFASQTNNSASGLPYDKKQSAVPASDDESGSKPDQRRRLRKPHPDIQEAPSRPPPGRTSDNSPPFVARGPPASRTVATSNMGSNPGMGTPGGMI
ncbi:hypothetical protein VTK56DRAFT_3847 [Thermocarpiscus australiensis]